MLRKGIRHYKCNSAIEMVSEGKRMIQVGRADGVKARLPIVVVRKEFLHISKANRANKCLRLCDESVDAEFPIRMSLTL